MNKIPFRKFIDFIIKNKIFTVIAMLLLLSIIYMTTFLTPKIYITTQIHSVTDKDYDLFVRYSKVPSEKKTRDNCRYITISIKVVQPALLVQNVKIEKAFLKEYILETQYFNKSTNKIEYLGYYFSNGNNKSFEGIDVYLDGMTDEKIKDFFKDYKIEITWTNVLAGKNKKTCYLKDYYQ